MIKEELGLLKQPLDYMVIGFLKTALHSENPRWIFLRYHLKENNETPHVSLFLFFIFLVYLSCIQKPMCHFFLIIILRNLWKKIKKIIHRCQI